MLFSGAFGVALAVAYGIASTLINRRALKASSQQLFMAIVVGGMMGRFAIVFCILLLSLLMLSIHQTAFILSFLVAFIPVLAVEVSTLHSRASAFTENVST